MQQLVHNPCEWILAAASNPGSVLVQRARSRPHSRRSMLFRNPTKILEVRQPAKILEAFSAMEEALAEGFFVAGYISYEAGFALEPSLADLSTKLSNHEPLLWLGCYRSPEICEEVAPSFPTKPSTPPMNLRFLLSADEYARKVEDIRSLIAAGETYQANLTMEVAWSTTEHPEEMYERLLRAQPVPYAALLHPMPGWHVLSLSPELFFARDGDKIVTRPMKGTASPGLDASETRANAAWLRADEKNRAENVMIVDLLRNDLGRICQAGSVRVTDLFEVERYPTVLQMTSTVEGNLRQGIGYSELFRALFPSGSIVGAPKIHTMRLLHALEKRVRGVYTGAIGYIDPDHVAEFNVAIRTISLRGGEARMGVGSGIVYDSEAALEYAECRMKASFLTRQSEQDFQLIETLLLQQGSYTLLDEHMERMAQSAEYFDMVFDDRVKDALDSAAQTHRDTGPTRVRLLLGRNGTVTWTASPIRADDMDPVDLLLRQERTDPLDVFLRHKTTRRALYDDAFRYAQAHGRADALFCNVREEITEGAIHNVIVSIDQAGLTPPLASGVLPGVYRRRLLEQRRISERVLKFHDLLKAEAVYVCNSVRGLRRVRRIDQESHRGEVFETVWSDADVCAPR
jgi:para-aminobenzoate synthetase/4-amino-4-deoxychorismate lyase